MKKCPYCAEEIQDEAIKCRFCNASLVTLKELPIKQKRGHFQSSYMKIKSQWKVYILSLVILLAITSGIILYKYFTSPIGAMAYVEGGTFMMGSDDQAAEDDEKPRHKVTLNSYYIDKTEVTVGGLKNSVRLQVITCRMNLSGDGLMTTQSLT